MASHAYTLGQQTETFNTGLGTWTTEFLNTANGFNFGWQNSGNASGAAGEFGGLIIRSNTAAGTLGMPRVLDTTSFASQSLSLNDALTVRGSLWINNVNSGSDLYLGYFNTSDPSGQRFALNIRPSGADERYRIRTIVTGSSLTAAAATYNAVQLEFNYSWVPSGLNDGSGAFSGVVALAGGGSPLVLAASTPGGANTYSFNSFGLWVDSASTTVDTQNHIVYFDNIEYTVAVPEPSAGLLGALGIAALAFVGRKRAAQK